MEITKTLLINAACLLIPPVVVVLLLRHFFPRKIRWSAGVVALVDLVIFWTDIFYYESVWLTLFLDCRFALAMGLADPLRKILWWNG